MFLEWWMIGILIAASVWWGEYRYVNGIREAVENVERRLGWARASGSHDTFVTLQKRGLLKIDYEKGEFIGYDNNTWNPSLEISEKENKLTS